jgi:hypothetical protein
MRVHSGSAFIAGLIALAPHLFLFIPFVVLVEPAETSVSLWEATILGFLTLPAVIALCASISEEPSFRIASLTAALVATIPPTYMLLFWVIGFFLLPGAVALLVATLRNLGKAGDPLTAIASLGAGVLVGLGLLAAGWRLFTHVPGANDGIATSLAIVTLALACLLATRAFPKPYQCNQL